MDDLFLIKQTLNGNPDAFRFIVLRYERPVFKFLNGLQLHGALVEEIAQEAFLRAYKNLGEYSPSKGASFSSWLFTIARNLALNELERHHHRMELLSSEKEQETITETPSTESSVEEILDDQLSIARLGRAINALPLQFRTAVVLSYLEDLTLEEISQIEGCSVGTVKSRVHRGKSLLRAALAGKGGIAT